MASARRFIVDNILERVISQRQVESYVIAWARLVYRLRKPRVVAITGSAGKSTTTAMITAVLSHPGAAPAVGEVGSTFSNGNDDIGVAAALLRFELVAVPYEYHRRLALLFAAAFRAVRALLSRRYPRVMVLECGLGSTANLERVVTIAPPEVSAVTTIGAGHLEIVGSIEGVVREKGALVRAVPPSGLVVLGREHEHVDALERMARAPVVKVAGRGIPLSQNISREVARHMGVPGDVVEAALREFKSPQGRLTRLDLPGLTVIDDTYNANPLSMKLGLDSLAEIAAAGGRRIAILGGMAELGDDTPRHHEEIAAHARARVDVLVGVGELARHYQPDHWFESTGRCADGIDTIVRDGDCVLLKGSASVRLWELVPRLRQIAEERWNVTSLRA